MGDLVRVTIIEGCESLGHWISGDACGVEWLLSPTPLLVLDVVAVVDGHGRGEGEIFVNLAPRVGCDPYCPSQPTLG